MFQVLGGWSTNLMDPYYHKTVDLPDDGRRYGAETFIVCLRTDSSMAVSTNTELTIACAKALPVAWLALWDMRQRKFDPVLI